LRAKTGAATVFNAGEKDGGKTEGPAADQNDTVTSGSGDKIWFSAPVRGEFAGSGCGVCTGLAAQQAIWPPHWQHGTDGLTTLAEETVANCPPRKSRLQTMASRNLTGWLFLVRCADGGHVLVRILGEISFAIRAAEFHFLIFVGEDVGLSHVSTEFVARDRTGGELVGFRWRGIVRESGRYQRCHGHGKREKSGTNQGFHIKTRKYSIRRATIAEVGLYFKACPGDFRFVTAF